MILRMIKYLIYLVLLLAVLVSVSFFFLKTPDTDYEFALKKYTNEHSKFAEKIKGLRIHYRDQGNPDGPVLFLIHGTSASLHTFEPMIAHLKEKYRTISLTLPGHGLTGPHPENDYKFSGYKDAIDTVAETLNIKKFTLAGNSRGGWISWRYALENPDKVNALILLAASGMPLREGEKAPESNMAFRLAQIPAGRYILENITPRSLVKRSVYQTVSVKESVTEEIIDRYWHLVRVPGNRKAAGLVWTADREKHFADKVKDIKAPTLIIWGKEDKVIHFTAATTFKEKLKSAKVIIYENIGHLPMEEAPKRTAEDIDNFLGTVLPKKEPEQEIQKESPIEEAKVEDNKESDAKAEEVKAEEKPSQSD